MIKKMTSSVALTWIVNRGGMKKKFQIKALNTAETITGQISNNTAFNDTANKRINATPLYPRNDAIPMQIPDTARIRTMLIRYCCELLIFFGKKLSIATKYTAKLSRGL